MLNRRKFLLHLPAPAALPHAALEASAQTESFTQRFRRKLPAPRPPSFVYFGTDTTKGAKGVYLARFDSPAISARQCTARYHRIMRDAREIILRTLVSSLFLAAVAGRLAAPASAQTTAAALPAAALPLPATPPDIDAPAYKPSLTFDVASVRETQRSSQVDMGIVNPSHKSEFSASSVSLHILIQLAYSFGAFQISGGPEWIDNRYFTVQAKSDPSVDEQLAKLSDDDARQEKLHMVQAMLADRFHLRAHWEIRQQPAYIMTIAKGGLKMQPAKLPVPQGDPSMAPTTPATGVHAHGGPQGIEIDGERFSMRAIALMLSTQLRTPVVDKTGDKGYYDFALQFNRDLAANPNPDAYPQIPAAVQDELGLKLEMQKGPVDVMVIDHAELPSEN